MAKSSSDRLTAVDDTHPFAIPWMNSCYQESLLPNSQWQQVHAKLCDGLAKKIEKQLENPQREQMIFELMGTDFLTKYFPHRTLNRAILEPPETSVEMRKKLRHDAQNWLQNSLAAVASDLGCSRPGEDDESKCQEMRAFLQHTQQIISTGMERHLYLKEQHLRDQWHNMNWQRSQKKSADKQLRERRRVQQEMDRLQRSTHLKSILRKDDVQTPASTPNAPAPRYTYNVKGARLQLTENPPDFGGMQSDSVGRCVAALLQREPRRFASVAAGLHGHQLAPSLRTYVWLDVLLAAQRAKQKHVNVEKLVRQKFAQNVSRGVTELGIRKATHSPISTLINNALIEVYDITPGLQMALQDSRHMKEAAKALNILYVYDRSYEPYLVHRLFPLQMALQTSADQGEHVYELAMYLDQLNKTCFPSWPAVFATAKTVLTRLHEADPQLHDHLKSVARVNATVNPKEFLQHLLHEEKAKAEALMPAAQTSSLILRDDDSQELLLDPLIFIRKWIGEGFVGVLDTQAAIFVWDQCFLQKWATRPIEDVCLALLLLLRHKFLESTNYSSMKKVFLEEPCLLYTMDIQRAWVHVQKDEPLSDVPALNRQLPVKEPAPIAQEEFNEADSIVSPQRLVLLPDAGIKHLRLEIVLPAQNIKKTSWLCNLHETSLSVHCKFHDDDEAVISVASSRVIPIFTSVDTDHGAGSRTHIVVFPNERFVVNGREVDARRETMPFAELQVKCKKRTENAWTDAAADDSGPAEEILLGTARIALYHQVIGNDEERGAAVMRSDDECWQLLAGEYFHLLKPVARDVLGEFLIGNESRLRATVFDPNEEEEIDEPPPIVPVPISAPPEPQVTRQPSPAKVPDEDPVCTADQPFDLYVDCIRNIPDNASVVKVTGRLFKLGDALELPDILAFPDPSSPARSPHFSFREMVDVHHPFSTEGLVLLRAYTVDYDSNHMVIIGSSLLKLYDEQGHLRIGGHCRQLYNGMLGDNVVISTVTQDSLNEFPRVSACRIYTRLLPHTDEKVQCPPLDGGYFVYDGPPFNQSEKNVLRSFENDENFPKTVEDMVVSLKANLRITDAADPTSWLQQRLDKRHLHGKPADNLDLTRAVNYRVNIGVAVQFIKAYGLPEGLYVQCFVRLVPGSAASRLPATENAKGGKDYKLTTLKHDYSSLQSSPRWLDEPKTIYPHCDSHSYLLVQVYGLKTRYVPHPEGNAPGTVTTPDGSALTLDDDAIIGWSIVSLFENKCVLSGKHHVPIFKGQGPDAELVNQLTSELPENILADKETSAATRFDMAALEVHVWDAHFTKDEQPLEMEPVLMLLGPNAERERYKQVEQNRDGKKMSAFVLETHAGTLTEDSGDHYERERAFYEETLGNTYYNLMESALMAAGDGPL